MKLPHLGLPIKKRYLLRNKEKYIGKWLTVEFEKYSKDKIPLKPTGKCTRDIGVTEQGLRNE